MEYKLFVIYIQVLEVYGVCVWGMYADMLGRKEFDILSTSQLPESDMFELVGARSDSTKMPWHF